MRNQRFKKSLFRFAGVSLFLHLQLILFTVAVLSLNPKACQSPDIPLPPFEVTMVDPVTDPPEVKKLEEEEKKEEEKAKDAKGQVVDLPKPVEERRPDKAKYLSEHDSRVKKETRARAQRFKAGKIIANRPIRVKPRKAQSPAEARKLAQKLMRVAMRTKPNIPQSELPPSDADTKEPQAAMTKEKPAVNTDKPVPQTEPQKNLSAKDLNLRAEDIAKALGTRVSDALKDVARGKSTLLNSKRWRFASFFNRVKRQVAQEWRPDQAYKRRDPGGNVYGFKDRVTILRVKLTPKGKLSSVHLEKASGLGFLDDVAISAFRTAHPFPNPPQGLVDKDSGLISFRFGFLFEISRQPSFKVFRAR
jgi:TonB family protein